MFQYFRSLITNIYSKGFFHLLSANYLIGFIGFASQLLLVKFLTPTEMQYIKLIQSYLAVFIIFAGFGFNTAILKICSEQIEITVKQKILFKNLIYTVFSIIVTTIIYILFIYYTIKHDNYLPYFYIYFLIVPANTIISLLITYFQALKNIKLIANIQSLIKVFTVFFIIFSTYYWKFNGFIFATVLSAWISLFAIFFNIKNNIIVDWSYKLERRNIIYAFWSLLANLVGALATNLDIFILDKFVVDRENFGYYSIATIFLMGLNYITFTIQSITTPYFSEKSNNRDEFFRVFYKYLKLSVIVAISTGTMAFILIPYFIYYLYGANYYPVSYYFRIIVFKYVFWSCYSLIGVAILSIGKMKFNFYMVIITLLISLILMSYFGKLYGITGVAYSQSISYLINLVILYTFGIRFINKVLR